MTQNYQIKKFIRDWDFPHPDWNKLPKDFPNCETEGLNKEEKHLFGAIKLAWMTSMGKGELYKNLARRSLLAFGVSLILVTGYSFFAYPESSFSKAVNAATISATFKHGQIQVQDILESTASALFKATQ